MAKTIVIVDDFVNTRKVIEFTVKKIEGTNILVADDGIEAIKYFNGQKIDLLITDLNMPNMDGLELSAEIKKIEAYKYMPILILSTETKEEAKEEAKKIGITGWIKKPFKAEDFIKVIEKCIK